MTVLTQAEATLRWRQLRHASEHSWHFLEVFCSEGLAGVLVQPLVMRPHPLGPQNVHLLTGP